MLLSLVLFAFLSSSAALKCWHTGANGVTTDEGLVTSLRATNVPVYMKECKADDKAGNKSCVKEWYTVGKVSDVFYRLGCSKMDAAAEKTTAMGTGEQTVYYCNKDFCNSGIRISSGVTVFGLLIL